jgi:hypothetical protein
MGLGGDRKVTVKLGVVAHTSNPSTQEAKAGRLRVQVQFRIHRETMSEKRRGGGRRKN